MNQWNVLVDAIKEEDRILRHCLTLLPRDDRDKPGDSRALSFKETLGHIAFWDDFTVNFFRCKLDATSYTLLPPIEFEERSRQELEHTRSLPFGEVLARYLESTGALLDFLKSHWDDLTVHERHGFWVPLKHRRHHRISLYQTFGLPQPDEADDSMAAGA